MGVISVQKQIENTLFAAVKIVIKSNSQACLPIAAFFIYFIYKALQLKGSRSVGH